MRRLIAAGCLLVPVTQAPVQAQHHPHDADSTEEVRRSGAVPGVHADAHEGAAMSSATLPGLLMSRDGSGTSWQPDASPVHAAHAQSGGWSLMLHGSVFARYTVQDLFDGGDRGGAAFSVPNWFMGMARHDLAPHGQVALRAMVSFDPVTEGGDGYPLLFQTGETFEGEPLVDRQHPHDLFSEVSVTVGRQLGDAAGVYLYAAYPGEPALGPPAFMHRPSARHNPNAPLGHHWQDATHIVFGVGTLGVRLGPVKLEGSLFTGKEPNEERFGFDRPRLDSYSARLSYNPTRRLALQISRGYLHSPEALEPELDMWRTTASAVYHVPLAEDRVWATTFVWGWNDPEEDADEDGAGHHTSQHSLLLESDLQLGAQSLYGRAEWVQKTAPALGVLEPATDELLNIGSLTLGAARRVFSTDHLSIELGAQGSVYAVPEVLEPVYGAAPVSAQVYLHLSPALSQH